MKKTSIKHIIRLLLLGLSTITVLSGATLKLNDGSSIEGELVKIHEGKVLFKTGFAGTLEIPQESVIGLQSEAPVALRTESGEVYQGPVREDSPGTLAVQSGVGAVRTSLNDVVSGWQPGATDPVVAAREAELNDQLRKWAYEAGFDITGREGNTKNFGSSLKFSATLEGPQDRLNFYGRYAYQKTEDIRTEDEQIVGVRYTNFFTEKLGWFVREELERDSFEGIDFRSTSALGLTRKFIEEERLTLEGSAGISYRFESYTDPLLENNDFPGLDFSLKLGWQFADWGKLSTYLSYVPSVDDFGDYLFEHESGIDIPLAASENWIMRFGLANQYNSNPEGNRKNLDTTYFARMILSWK